MASERSRKKEVEGGDLAFSQAMTGTGRSMLYTHNHSSNGVNVLQSTAMSIHQHSTMPQTKAALLCPVEAVCARQAIREPVI